MPGQSKPNLVRRLFAAYLAKERAVVEAMLTDDFRFTSPYDDEIDRAAYFERCWPTSILMRSVVLEEIFTEGDGAFVRYRTTTMDGREFRNTEFFQFEGDRVRRIDVYFGATYKAGVFLKQS